MTRIPCHTIDDAPPASRALLDMPASPEPDGPAGAGFTAAAAGQGHG